jgi:hypothetical protein
VRTGWTAPVARQDVENLTAVIIMKRLPDGGQIPSPHLHLEVDSPVLHGGILIPNSLRTGENTRDFLQVIVVSEGSPGNN